MDDASRTAVSQIKPDERKKSACAFLPATIASCDCPASASRAS